MRLKSLKFHRIIHRSLQLENLIIKLDAMFLQQLLEWLVQLDTCQGQGCWLAEKIPPGLDKP